MSFSNGFYIYKHTKQRAPGRKIKFLPIYFIKGQFLMDAAKKSEKSMIHQPTFCVSNYFLMNEVAGLVDQDQAQTGSTGGIARRPCDILTVKR
jgi:hypothetical protein